MRKVALLPNIFTTGNIVSGIFAIMYSLSALHNGELEDFKKACWMIMLAILLDGLDGKIAVLTRSCSDFGVHYDSMADLVSFGVAPAFMVNVYLLIYQGQTGPITPIGWAIMLVLVVCVALRLARFNLQVYQDEKNSFEGLPSPTPAALIAMLLLSSQVYEIPLHPIVLLLISIGLGGLMVSHIPYPSLKQKDSFMTPLTFFGVVLGIALIVMEPPATLFLLLSGYVAFGFLRFMMPERVHSLFARFGESKKTSP
ncbi:MAG: CDP-diacylglycerol--serine O-phosphatidyltransferase [Candidatus Omnitrophica bacterium]|nr:CDP-diacylglycerol--serine O-phosphatidyltransferase [Candidatus Omnitrophota bacterium]